MVNQKNWIIANKCEDEIEYEDKIIEFLSCKFSDDKILRELVVTTAERQKNRNFS